MTIEDKKVLISYKKYKFIFRYDENDPCPQRK